MLGLFRKRGDMSIWYLVGILLAILLLVFGVVVIFVLKDKGFDAIRLAVKSFLRGGHA